MRPATIQINLLNRAIRSEISLNSFWITVDAAFDVDIEYSDQTAHAQLIWVLNAHVRRYVLSSCDTTISWNAHSSKWNKCAMKNTLLLTVSTLNPFMPNWFFYLNSLDRSISYIRGLWLVFIIIMFCRNVWTYCIQCRAWSDAAFCGVWSGSTLFANVPLMGR